MKKFCLCFLFCFFTASMPWAAIVTEDITYEEGGITFNGYTAYDDQIKGKRPGVLVVHEWWGHNEYARERARMLAELGYVAMAIDMYGSGKVAKHPDDAGKFASEVSSSLPEAKRRFSKAMRILQRHALTHENQIAAIGYCFGGGVVLNMARMGTALKGVVSFHGSLGTQTPAEKGKVKASILVCHGADDSFVSQEQIEAFQKEMDAAEVHYRLIFYPGAVHSFTNPGSDAMAQKFGLKIGYNKEADEKSWSDMRIFFDEIFHK